MSNRLDDVFSLEKLRRTWKGAAGSEREPPSGEGDMTADASTAQASYRRLRETIERCFSPDCAATMEPLLVELQQLLEQLFPADGPVEMLQAERAKIAMAVDGLLNRIEDLLEAFEIGATRM
ncbi:MAG: hypothetical protein AB9866_00810 [Syntrophobacteraceae bacterium]